MIKFFLQLAVLMFATKLFAVECQETSYEEEKFILCEVDTENDKLTLHLHDDDGELYGGIGSLRRDLKENGQTLEFAINAGMYHDDGRPVGYYVENGEEFADLQLGQSYGNFGLVPNGVFCVLEKGFFVFESEEFARINPECTYATQSGPMLVIDGALHPRFIKHSDSRYIRNGVGVSNDGQNAYFVISKRPINFHKFASYFKVGLGIDHALFLDGAVSQLYSRNGPRRGFPFPLGPILAVTKDSVE